MESIFTDTNRRPLEGFALENNGP